jgi:hypothetical protein
VRRHERVGGTVVAKLRHHRRGGEAVADVAGEADRREARLGTADGAAVAGRYGANAGRAVPEAGGDADVDRA